MAGKYRKIIFGVFLFVIAVGLASSMFYFSHGKLSIFEPKGIIAFKEKNLILLALGLMLIAVIPAFVLVFYFAWRYRAGSGHDNYSPEGGHKRSVELLFWLLPLCVVLALSFITWKSAHDVDPFKSLDSAVPPININVVALDWKWLFIYSDQNIATVNFVQFPVNTPVHFRLTADAPMNSFWIPQLGGQIYAMAGMVTQLNLMASEPGEYQGQASEINGRGFAGMKFIAKATSLSDFNNWVDSVKLSSTMLTIDEYNKLAEPSENNPPAFYSAVAPGLYGGILRKYMGPPSIR